MATIPEALELALQHHRAGRLPAAEQLYRQILAAQPEHPDALHLLGLVAHQVGQHQIAIDYIEKAIGLNGTEGTFYNNLGEVYRALSMIPQAVVCYRRALELKPDFAKAHNNLGVAFKGQGRLDEVVACLRRALELKPDYVEAHNNLGNAFQCQGNLNEAVSCFCRALELKPDYAEAHNNLGVAFKDQGKLDEAVACYRRALELKPDFVEAYNNLLLGLLYQSSASPNESREAHAEFNNRFAIPLLHGIQPHVNDRSPARRLRIGYVSPDFRDHVVGRNVWPLFREHDREQFEVFAYANSWQQDEFTAGFQSAVAGWREVLPLDDEALAKQIRDDRIDILVDLALHTSNNRLLVFARKPAPIQVTFAGYPGTTGLTAIDYRLTDPYLDPPGLFDRCYSEQSIRLPATWWCYDSPTGEPAVNALPAKEPGSVTFGCLNNFCKVNAPTLQLWAAVLREFPRSQLLLLAPEGTARRETLELLAEEGIAADRVAFVAQQPRPQYLQLYQGIDIGLDTLPYNGHTTSLDSLWMGVPVVTLPGQTVVGRAGLSQLTNLGLPELIAQSPTQFVQIAAELARDLPRLAQLRTTLRQRMRSSPLMDATRFTRGIEAAYRTMWQRWCAE